jgi:2-polyprenyl-3-methyl-5-hydroxy-6-metoxy-1,4-benzoquinol methylase
MKISQALRQPTRILSHLLLDKSYENYHSAETWEHKYSRDGYDLSVPKEDGRYGALTALLRRYDRGGPILDAGCGDGLLALHYRPLSESRLVGIDYSQAAIDVARQRHLPNTEFHAANFTEFRPATSFSVIVFNEALYYIADYAKTLRSLESLLRPDGVFLISMFDTVVTRRIWKALGDRYRPTQTVLIKDGQSGTGWTISVLPRPDDRA